MITWIETYLPNVYKLGLFGDAGWLTAIYNTLFMTILPFVIGGFVGLVVGLFLVIAGPNGVVQRPKLTFIVDKITSIFRAIPFIILLAILSPLTLLLTRETLGPVAALVPLSFAVFPFFARQVQVVLSELDRGVIEASQASGATLWDLIWVYLSEGLPDLVRVSTVTLISLVGETAMAGAIGAGGLGTLAVSYGYQNYREDITWVATIIILLLIFGIQFLGDFLTKRLSHR